MSSLWIASSVSTTNGSNLVTVQSNEDITGIRPNSLIQVGANPLMEVKRTFLTDSGVKTIELFENWEFGAVTGQRAIAAPTLGEIKSLADDVRRLISSAEEVVETTNINPAGGSIAKRTSDGRLKAEPATEANDVITKKQTGTAISRNVTTSSTDTTDGRLLKLGDFGQGTFIKNYDLKGQAQKSAYRKSVIALCEVTNDVISFDSFSSGEITFHRRNSIVPEITCRVHIAKQYNSTKINGFWKKVSMPQT